MAAQFYHAHNVQYSIKIGHYHHNAHKCWGEEEGGRKWGFAWPNSSAD